MNLISLSPFQSCGGASLFHGDLLVLLISDIIEVDLVRILLAHCRLLNNFGVRDNVLAYLSSDALRFTLRSHVVKLLCVLLILLLLKIVLAFHGFKLISLSVLLFTNSYRSLTIIIVLPRITSNLLRITLIISKPIISHWLICSLHRCIPSLPRDVQEWFGVLWVTFHCVDPFHEKFFFLMLTNIFTPSFPFKGCDVLWCTLIYELFDRWGHVTVLAALFFEIGHK